MAFVLGGNNAWAGQEFYSGASFFEVTRIDRAASNACRNRGFSTESTAIAHFSDNSIRVATPNQIRTRTALTSTLYFVRYEGTTACTIYVVAQAAG